MKVSKLGAGLVASATVLAALAAQWGRVHEQTRHPAGLMAHAQGSATASLTAATVWPSDAPVGFGEWTYVGPDNVAGAAQDVVVEPTTGNLYALSTEGWVFRSTDGAATWNAVARFNTNLPMSRLEIQSDATGVTAYLGITGVDSYSTPHLLRMTPDGQTSDLTLNAFEVRTAGTSIYAIDKQGVWLSNDNGEHWNHVVAADSGQITPYCSDVEIAGSNVFVMCGMRDLYDGFYDGARNIYRSTSGGQFVKVWTAPAGMWTGYTGKLAVSRSNPNVVYASYRYGYGHGAYVFRTTDGGTSWQLRTDPAGANPFNNSLLTDFDQRCANDGYGRPTEDHVLEVDPANPDILWVGAIELYRSDDGGLNFGRASLDSSKGTGAYFLPRNIRALRFSKAYNGGSNRSVYIAAQDGVYSSTDARAAVQAAPADMCSAPGAPPAMTWTKRIAGYTTAAFAAVDVTADGEVLASLGRRSVYASEEEENQAPSRGLFHGDLADPGSWARLSYVQPRLLTLDPMVGVDRFYTSRCPGGLYCRWDWSASLHQWEVTARQQDPYSSTPDDFRSVTYIPDPSDRSRFWGKNLSRSTDGMSTWVSAGTSPSAPTVVAGAVSPADPNLVLLVDDSGRLFRRTDALSTDASTTWSAAEPFPFRFGANGVHFDPSDPNRVYAFGWDESNHKVFASNDAGQTWESADQPGAQDGLRDGEVRSLVTDIDSRDVLYAAADGFQPGESGLFVTWNYKSTNGPAWHAVPTPFEGASIAKLVMRKRSDGRKVLYAFTAGRGIWAATVSEHRFDDVSADHWAVDFINRLARAGVTSGCASNPPMYCPGDVVTRDQMAAFLLRAEHGSSYQPPAAIGVFADVPTNYWAASWIERLREEGITNGCASNPLQYCPGSAVTRDQMAVFLLRAKHGASYQPPAAVGMFADVPANHWAAAWIEQLSREGVTNGCSSSPAMYCPGNPVTRDQMAVFLVRAFEL